MGFFPFFVTHQLSYSLDTTTTTLMDWERNGKKNYIIFVFFYRRKYIILFSLVFHFLSFWLIFASFFSSPFSSTMHIYYIYSHLKSVDYFRLCIVYKRETSFSLLRINTGTMARMAKWMSKKEHTHTQPFLFLLWMGWYLTSDSFLFHSIAMRRQLLCSRQQQQQQLVNTEHTTLSFLFMASFQPMKADNTQKGKAVKLFVFFYSIIATTAATVRILISFFCYATSIYCNCIRFYVKLQFTYHTRTHILINFELKIRDAQI